MHHTTRNTMKLAHIKAITGQQPTFAHTAASVFMGSIPLLAAHCSNGCLRQKPQENPFQFSKAFDLLYTDDICSRNYDRGKAQQI